MSGCIIRLPVFAYDMVKDEDFELFDKGASKHITLPHHKGRIFIVGDIHGCFDELCDLLDKYRQNEDILILAGDLVRFFGCLDMNYVMRRRSPHQTYDFRLIRAQSPWRSYNWRENSAHIQWLATMRWRV